MTAILKDIEKQALQLSSQERGALIRSLISSLEGVPADASASIAKACGCGLLLVRRLG
jgi:hypothetical protein